MNLDTFLNKLNNSPDDITFNDTMAVIEVLYNFTPAAFKNGDLINEPGKNSGSCKLFAFAQIHGLSVTQTLNCFGAYYRDDVLHNPHGDDHLNIRNFMKHGWAGIKFTAQPLQEKQNSQ